MKSFQGNVNKKTHSAIVCQTMIPYTTYEYMSYMHMYVDENLSDLKT